jgi:endonuclease YncB( thermonuclease family)
MRIAFANHFGPSPMRFGLLHGFIFASAVAAAFQAAAGQPCKLADLGTARAAAVRDGRTLTLADGRVLRLKGIEVSTGADAALKDLVAGKPLRLKKIGEARDRYGRLEAFAFPGTAEKSLQEMLLAQGLARVSGRVGSEPCAEILLTAESVARAAKRGIWTDPNSAPLRAENLTGIRSLAGHFALVEGKVLSVHTSGGTIYLNFGPRWTRDFSVIILRRNQRSFAAAGIELKGLAGQRIRVRGWVEERRGPVIVAEFPGQIEQMN